MIMMNHKSISFRTGPYLGSSYLLSTRFLKELTDGASMTLPNADWFSEFCQY